jgi:outer membrane protein OmpA-like peptidoglycan-associated protein
MSRFGRIAGFAAFAALVAVAPALASAQSRFDVQVQSKVLAGQGKPTLVVTATEPLKGVEVVVSTGDTIVRKARAASLKSYGSLTIALDQAPGRVTYRVSMKAAGMKEPEEIEFVGVVAKPMKIEISKDTVDLAEGRIAFTATEPVAKVKLTLLTEGGRELTDREFEVQTPAGGTTKVEFTPPTEPVGQVRLTAYDADGFFNGVDISPFFVEVPHEEVTFEFGKSDIVAAEEPKLERTLESVRAALRKFGNEFRARLYVAGYTDTVGSRESNQDLSHKRAMSIAHWFSTHGLEVRVCAQGFGEDVLAVQTPDETPEARNRRTLHVLANQTPPVSKPFPRQKWHCF